VNSYLKYVREIAARLSGSALLSSYGSPTRAQVYRGVACSGATVGQAASANRIAGDEEASGLVELEAAMTSYISPV
jgi:hypothetical protein